MQVESLGLNGKITVFLEKFVDITNQYGKKVWNSDFLSMLKKEVSLYLLDHLQFQKLQLIVEANTTN